MLNDESLEMNVVISRKKIETRRSTQFSVAQETETKKTTQRAHCVNSGFYSSYVLTLAPFLLFHWFTLDPSLYFEVVL